VEKYWRECENTLQRAHVRVQQADQEKSWSSWAPVAHAYNPSYSGGKDQEDLGSKLAWANSSTSPYLQKPYTKIGLVEWPKVKALSSTPTTAKKKKKKRKKEKEKSNQELSAKRIPRAQFQRDLMQQENSGLSPW
jgi:hypothetical protein